MATRSVICKETLNKTYVGIYCHWDGYPDGVGKILFEHYNTAEKVNQLLALGALSSLEENVAPPEGSTHSFDTPLPNVCVAYHRDRGEEMRAACPIKIERAGEDYGAEYAYVFRLDGTWYMRDFYGEEDELRPLTKEDFTEDT